MSIERVLIVALCAVSAVMLARSGPAAVAAWRIYAGTGRRRQHDATGKSPAMPSSVADRITSLAELGYRHIGETSLDLPGGRRFAWILAAEDAESYVMLAGGLSGVALTGIYSAWQDGTWLGTQHPLGQAVDRGGLRVQIVLTTLADAVDLHRRSVDQLRRTHGDPRPIRAMAEMLALDADYRERFGGSRLGPLTARIMLPGVLSATAFALSVLLLVIGPR